MLHRSTRIRHAAQTEALDIPDQPARHRAGVRLHIVGLGAGDIISECVHAIEMAATADDMERTIHPHPTLSETVMEGAALLHDRSPHYKARR